MGVIIAKQGMFFRHKVNKNRVHKFLFLKEGETIDDYEQVSFSQVREARKGTKLRV